MNSSTASWPWAALAERVCTFMPSPAVIVHAACSFGMPSISTRHMRQAPIAGPSRGS